MEKENREYKDSMFTDLFYSDEDAEKNLLSLYNALYGTNYTDTSVIRKFRIDDVLFKNFNNDIAFVVDNRSIILGEHQSTVNPNMPLRDLMYIGREYERLIPVDDRYRSTLVKIPTPEFITFYNGKEEQPDEQILRLSDAFMERTEEIKLELKVRVFNINFGHNKELMEKCRVLKEYSLFVDTARKYAKDKHALAQAIKECIAEGVLAGYLKRKGGEVMSFLMAKYDYEMDMRIQREEAEQRTEQKVRAEMQEELQKAEDVAKEANKQAEDAAEDAKKANKRAEDAEDAAKEANKRADNAEMTAKIATAKRMLKMGSLSYEVIAQAVEITLEEVQQLAKEQEEK